MDAWRRRRSSNSQSTAIRPWSSTTRDGPNEAAFIEAQVAFIEAQLAVVRRRTLPDLLDQLPLDPVDLAAWPERCCGAPFDAYRLELGTTGEPTSPPTGSSSVPRARPPSDRNLQSLASATGADAAAQGPNSRKGGVGGDRGGRPHRAAFVVRAATELLRSFRSATHRRRHSHVHRWLSTCADGCILAAGGPLLRQACSRR